MQSYDFKKVVLMVGPYLARFFAPVDDAITIENEADDWSDESGADGEVVRSKSNDARATMTLKMQQTSPFNDEMSALRLADLADEDGVVPVLLRDGSGNTTHFAGHGWIMKPANSAFGQNAQVREWKIRLARVASVIGGAPQVVSG